MAFLISPNLPANVVEIGNEITQAKLNEINSGTIAIQNWVNSNFAPLGSIGGIGEAPSDGYPYVRYNSGWSLLSSFGGGGGIAEAPTDGQMYARYMGSWTSFTTGTGISDAPSDGNAYVRYNGNWSLFSSFDQSGSGITDAPSDGVPYVRINGVWNPMSWYDQTGGGGGGGISTSDVSYWLTQNYSGSQPYNISTGRILSWNGASLEWIDPPSGGGGGGISDAPYDWNYYLRYNESWTQAQLVWSMDTYGNWRNFVCV